MKKLFFAFSALFALSLLQALSSAPPPNAAVELTSAWEGNNLVYKTKNNDFCDYSIMVNLASTIGFDGPSSPYTGIVGRGELKLFTLKWDGSGTGSSGFTYWTARGNIYEKPNVGFVYALPVKQGDSVRVATKEGRDYTLSFDLTNASDTVYACRGGIVCDNSLADETSKGASKYDRSDKITVYHKDGTMADYDIGKSFKSLVFPGNIVEMGDPIAVLKRTGATIKVISVGIYFLDRNKFNNTQTGSKYTGFVPVFHTTAGDMKLAPKTIYAGEITDQVATGDMSKREKERYLKAKATKK